MSVIVPGLGYAGLGQMTRATQTLFSQAMRGRSTGARRARGTAKKRPKKRAAKRATSRISAAFARRSKRSKRSKPARLVRGSAAAKRYMAKIRKMRK